MDYEQTWEEFLISTDKSKLDIHVIHQYLSKESYWAKNIPLEIVRKSIEGSVCFGLYHQQKQIGFARVITDGVVFGYLADVFIIKEFRGQGLSKWIMQFILAHPDLQNFRRWLLGTRDAHGLYKQFGFNQLDHPEIYMVMKLFDEYPET